MFRQLADASMEGNDLIFIDQSNAGQIYGREKSIIKAHVAKRPRQKSRFQLFRQDTKTDPPCPPRRRDSQVRETRCSIHGVTFVEFCSECSLLVKMSTPLARQSGNSDPFDAQSVHIDAMANYYLMFGHNFLETVIWKTGFRGWGPPRGWSLPKKAPSGVNPGPDLYGGLRLPQGISYTVTSSWSTTHACAILAYCASSIFAITGNIGHARNALEYTTQCITGLRKLITESTYNLKINPEELIYRLFRAEIVSRNYSSAVIHASLLRDLLTARARGQMLNRGILAMVLYQDNNLALMLWKRPTFDELWVEEIFRTDWAQADLLSEQDVAVMDKSISPCIKRHRLRGLLRATKTLFLQTASMQSKGQIASSNDWYWFTSHSDWLQICLINYYMDHDLARALVPTNSAVEMDLCLTLTTLYALRYQKNEPMVNGTPLYPISANILERLSSSFAWLESSMSLEEVLGYQDALLWILFVASLAEHRLPAVSLQQCHQTEKWSHRLTQIIVSKGLCGWGEMQEILKRFPYTEQELPLPAPDWLDYAFERSRHEQRVIEIDER